VNLIVEQIIENKTNKNKITHEQSKQLSEKLSNINLALKEIENK